MDGSVKSGPVRRQIEQLAAEMLPAGRARLFNQALMDLGGLVCLPRAPHCRLCPLSGNCLAFKRGTVGDRPQKDAAPGSILIEMATGILMSGGKLFIQQRQNDDIWGGLWEFPGGRLEQGEEPADCVVREYREETGFQVIAGRKITTVSHCYTRYRVVLHCFPVFLVDRRLQPKPVLTAAQDFRWLEPVELKLYGFPAGHRKMLEYMEATCPELLASPGGHSR